MWYQCSHQKTTCPAETESHGVSLGLCGYSQKQCSVCHVLIYSNGLYLKFTSFPPALDIKSKCITTRRESLGNEVKFGAIRRISGAIRKSVVAIRPEGQIAGVKSLSLSSFIPLITHSPYSPHYHSQGPLNKPFIYYLRTKGNIADDNEAFCWKSAANAPAQVEFYVSRRFSFNYVFGYLC